VLIDAYKVAHWMNVRKLTPAHVERRADLADGQIRELLTVDSLAVSDEAGRRLSETLAVDAAQIAAAGETRPTALVRTAAELHATRRAIQRDGIHFYNYYTMAAPPGRVGPVVLDILCSQDRLPALNHGHLEPAITINLGPGDINGRWGEELGESTWQVLRANRGKDAWIVGDSYVEPAYCPHTYSLASGTPARIISYTGASNLAPLLDEVNEWADHAFAALQRELADAGAAALLRAALNRRALEPADAAAAAGVAADGVEAFLAGRTDALALAELRALGTALGFDHRILLSPTRRHDEVGKTCCTVDQSRAGLRRFRAYEVASTASAPHLPDLTGQFMRVSRGHAAELDLCDGAETHYMVTEGALTVSWLDADGTRAERWLTPDGTAWVAPYVAHAWSGEGALIRLGSGRPAGYLDQLELSNTYAAAATLRRGRRSAAGWGYDGPEGG
jgi:2-hydroxyethylphosphonate dioxygenase